MAGGDDVALEKVKRLLKREDIHLVVFEGTGGVADEVAKCRKSEGLEELLGLSPGSIEPDERVTLCTLEDVSCLGKKLLEIKVKRCKKKSLDQDWYFNMDSRLDFSESNYENLKAQLSFNNSDDGKDTDVDILFYAIRADEAKFTKMMLTKEKGILEKFLTLEMLERLMREAISQSIDKDDLNGDYEMITDNPTRNKLPKLKKSHRNTIARLIYDEIYVSTVVVTIPTLLSKQNFCSRNQITRQLLT